MQVVVNAKRSLRRHAQTTCPLIVFWSPLASAHGGLDIGGLYQGLITVVLHWEQALFLLVCGLWCAQQRPDKHALPGILVALGMLLGIALATQNVRLGPLLLSGALAYTLVGLVVAIQLRGSATLVAPVAIIAGLANGVALGAGELPTLTQPWLFTLGLTLGVALFLFYVTTAVARLPLGWPWVGVRVVGSWVAAIGLIVGAFALAPIT